MMLNSSGLISAGKKQQAKIGWNERENGVDGSSVMKRKEKRDLENCKENKNGSSKNAFIDFMDAPGRREGLEK